MFDLAFDPSPSYGVGPSGVFCLASYLYEQIEREKRADVFYAAKLFRVQRPKLIETKVGFLLWSHDMIIIT